MTGLSWGGGPPPRGLSWRGRAAFAIFGIHAILLFFPPLPPDVKGSLWDYVLAYSAVLLGALELARWAPILAARWSRLSGTGRAGGVYGAAAMLLVLGWGMQDVLPGLFARFSREEGLWEPVNLLVYIGAALVLLASSGEGGRDRRKHLRLLGILYALLALEEVDYFGIFGGFIGRIDGVYVGFPHDLVRLWAEGLLPPGVAAALAVALLAVAAAAWRAGYFQPDRLVALLRPRTGRWLLPGALLVGFALAGEAHLFGLGLDRPMPEEVLELAGALFLGALALEVAAGEPAANRRAPARR